MNKYMKIAYSEAIKGMTKKDGGPFGAVIIKDNKVVARGHNMVLTSNDPTAHAEITTIRKACKKLNTYDLTNCILYTSSEPCPMCMAAIIWSNIKEVYFGSNRFSVESIGFRDKFIYDYLKEEDKKAVTKIQIDEKEGIEILKKYTNTRY